MLQQHIDEREAEEQEQKETAGEDQRVLRVIAQYLDKTLKHYSCSIFLRRR